MQKIKVESPSQYASRVIAEYPSDIKSVPIQTAASKYNASPGGMYSERESPAHILADVKEPQTMQALDETLSSPAPAKASDVGASIRPEKSSAESDELKDKLASIEAIGCMAAEGNPEAVNLLFKQVQNENFLVRHEAVRGILQYGGRRDKELLKETLPAGDWYIMDIRPADMRKVC